MDWNQRKFQRFVIKRCGQNLECKHENSTCSRKCGSMTVKASRNPIRKARSVQANSMRSTKHGGLDALCIQGSGSQRLITTPLNLALIPVHLMYALEQSIRREQLPEEVEKRYLVFIKAEARAALCGIHRPRDPESLSGILFGLRSKPCSIVCGSCRCLDRRSGLQGPRYRPVLNRALLNQELTKIEKPAGIASPKDFRNEVVKFSLPVEAQNSGKNPSWTSYEKIREVIEKRIFRRSKTFFRLSRLARKRTAYRKEARRVCRAHGGARLYRASGSPASSNGTCG